MKTAIGERIRRMREAQALSQEQVCVLTGVTTDRLAAYESGRAIPSVGVVIKLARVLGSRVDGILHGGDAMPHPLIVCRAGDAGNGAEQADNEQGYRYRTLGRPGSPGQGMEPLLITFDPGQGDGRPIAHDGQEFVYVLEGRVELLHDGQRHTLGPGDSVYLDATRPHLFRALGDTPSRAVGVVWSAG
ncbi:MAG TPA: cupin domain-containing protein [Anaeromyxobacter sp.]|nr:cupin domain-containing protein [Anaeromyxobacter sp.]